MAAGRADYLGKRLAAAGLTPDAIGRYTDTLRQFLTAKLTKIKFEDEMAKVLPRDKYHVHNSIIRELLTRAHQKREGVPDVPVLAPVRDKRAPSRKERAPQKISAGNSLLSHPKGELLAKQNAKRKREEYEHDPKPNGIGDPNRGKAKGFQKKMSDSSYLDKGRSKIKTEPDKQTLKRPKLNVGPALAGTNGAMGPPTTNGSMMSGRGGPPSKNSLAVPTVEVPSYDSLVFQPVRPGQAIDFELFRKLRARMASAVELSGGLAGVKDEAVGLMTHALEMQVKKVMEAAVRERVTREHTRPTKSSRAEAVTAYDVREAVLRDLSLLGSDGGMVLERLAMLL